jgi:hypothetical protein
MIKKLSEIIGSASGSRDEYGETIKRAKKISIIGTKNGVADFTGIKGTLYTVKADGVTNHIGADMLGRALIQASKTFADIEVDDTLKINFGKLRNAMKRQVIKAKNREDNKES